MSFQYTPTRPVSIDPLYASCISNIKQKARTWGITSQSFAIDLARIDSQIRVHGAYGAYNELEKLWHVEFYMWGRYFGTEPFPFPFPSAAIPTLVSAANPAPALTGPRAWNSTPVPNPYPPVYIPGPLQTPSITAGSFSPALGSGSRAQLSHHHQGSSPGSGLRSEFSIRGMAEKGGNGGSPHYKNMGQAYNNRPTRGRGFIEPKKNTYSEAVGGQDRVMENGGSNGNGNGGCQRGRGAVFAARRQLKIARRTGGRG